MLKLVLVLWAIVSALYKEEAGVFDWHQKHIGTPKFIEYSQERIIAGTDRGILASLKSKNADISNCN